MSATLTASRALSGSIAAARPPHTVTVTRSGQATMLDFEAAKDARFEVEIVDLDAVSGEDDGASVYAYGYVLEPNGNEVERLSGRETDEFVAPRTGTHRLVVYLGGNQTGTIHVKLTALPEPIP